MIILGTPNVTLGLGATEIIIIIEALIILYLAQKLNKANKTIQILSSDEEE